MVNIIGHRKKYLTISILLVLASWIIIAVFGIRLGRDFTGGALLEFRQTPRVLERADVEEIASRLGLEGTQVTFGGEGGVLVRMKSIDEESHQKLLAEIKSAAVSKNAQAIVDEIRFESIGPTVGQEMRSKAMRAIVYALIAIVVYVAWAFRKVSKPVQSWKYGLIAIAALIHDISIPAGIFALLGRLAGVEIDALFVTALLTILGFSVHDTIVVFDRIRENLLKKGGSNFEEIVNLSVNETFARSVNTSLTTFLVLAALYAFGGESTQHFVLALIIGIVFGTYSSIFVASPLLVAWHKLMMKGKG